VEGGKCSICHVGHLSSEKSLLARPPAKLCSSCHGGHEQFSHPVGGNVMDPRNGQPMTCLSCHNPHGTGQKSLLLANPARELCVSCHGSDNKVGKKRTTTAAGVPGAKR
jgi:predicted CXXCH cytochrome family protein